MDEMEVIKLLLNNAGLPSALIGLAIVLRPVMMAWIASAVEQRALEAKRLDSELQQAKELATALDGVRAQLSIAGGINNQLIDRLNSLGTWSEKHEGAIKRVHDDVRTIPAEVWRMGDPKLDAIRAKVKETETAILSALSPHADNARAAVRAELEGIVKRLDEVSNTLRRFEPGETKSDRSNETHEH